MASYFQNLVQDSDSMFDPSRFAAPLNYLHYSFALRQLAGRSEGEHSTNKFINALSLTPVQPGDSSCLSFNHEKHDFSGLYDRAHGIRATSVDRKRTVVVVVVFYYTHVDA